MIKGNIVIVDEELGDGSFDTIAELVEFIEATRGWRPVVHEDDTNYFVDYHMDGCCRRVLRGMHDFSTEIWEKQGRKRSMLATEWLVLPEHLK